MGQILSSIFRLIRSFWCGDRDQEQDETEQPNNKSSLLIPTPETSLLLHSTDIVSNWFDTEEESSQGSASECVSHVDTPELLSDTNSGFQLNQAVTTTSTCIDIVEENWQDSAFVLDVDNLEQGQVRRRPERWMRHYCSSHKILLVGEGDFSFSACLARAFGCATNMVASSLDSRGFLFRNYKKAMSNIHELRTRGCMVLHDVDATEMASHCTLRDIKFDRIVYNFPHAGFCSDEPGESQKKRHQLLISLFFKNAKEMIYVNGEIHVTHKSNGFFLDWNIKGLASAFGLRLIREVPFSFADYPGYRTKYGFGGDRNFNSNPSKTYKFGLVQATSQ